MLSPNLIISILSIAVLAFFSVASFFVPVAKKAAVYLSLFDDSRKSNRKIHKGAVPFLGGAAVYAGLVLSFSVYFIFFHRFHSVLECPKWFGAFMAGGLLVLIVGTIDDIYDISPLKKLLAQMLIVSLVFIGGIQLDHITVPFHGVLELGGLSFPATVLFMVAVMNAVNMVDGMDGLAGGIVLVACIANLVAAVFFQLYFVAFIIFVLAFCMLGFLRHNWYPASIFLGDGGSLLIGYCIAVITIQNIQSASNFGQLLPPLLVLFYPALDVLFAIVRRTLRGKPMMSADKGHFHHFLMKKGLSSRTAVNLIMVFSALLAVSGMFFLSGHLVTGSVLFILIFLIASVMLIASGYFDRSVFQAYLAHRSLLKKFNAYKSYLVVRAGSVRSDEDVWSIMVDIAREFCLKGACWADGRGFERSFGELPPDRGNCLADNMEKSGGRFIYAIGGAFDEHVNSEIEAIIKAVISVIDKKLSNLRKREGL